MVMNLPHLMGEVVWGFSVGGYEDVLLHAQRSKKGMDQNTLRDLDKVRWFFTKKEDITLGKLLKSKAHVSWIL
jgi:hypothetical protein